MSGSRVGESSLLGSGSPAPLDRGSSTYVAGHRGLVGRALVARLERAGFADIVCRTRFELDLCDARAVDDFFARERPRYVFMAAARVGGILANSTRPVEFLAENLRIELNVIESAHAHGVERLLFLGSSCIYPRLAKQPITEDALLAGPLEPTNEAYAVAKIAGVRLCDAYAKQHGAAFFSAMPTNLYGPHDNFDLETSHVLPALIRRFHEARERGDDEVVVWGSGSPRREFLYVDDLADACLYLMDRHAGSGLVNVGTGVDVTIAELAGLVARIVGFAGRIAWDRSRPDGTPRKLLDVSRMRDLGWVAPTSLEAGLQQTYEWYVQQASAVARASD